MTTARTAAAGAEGLLPEVLAYTSSLTLDRALLREDLVGSLAHLSMLQAQGLLQREVCAKIRGELVALAAAGPDGLPDEEDVHMAVEAHLTARLGPDAGRLHTARSRNDQVALDLRLHVREQTAAALRQLSALLEALAARASEHLETWMPAYTHRQRAQPVSLGYLLCGWGAMFARDAATLQRVLEAADELPLGTGAVGGTTLPIDREHTRRALGFSRITLNGLDTVGDRDFALDYTFAAAKVLLHIGRLATDAIDFSTTEFGFVKLGSGIACGSSMMPQKRNPDLFELLRGKGGRAVGNLTSLFVTLKGLPGGYNRDQQEDRLPILETGPLLGSALAAVRLGLAHLQFDTARMLRAVEEDAMQATDLAEALVRQGQPFRSAYQAVGALVRRCQITGVALANIDLRAAQEVDVHFTPEVLAALDPTSAAGNKKNAGGPAPAQVRTQIQALQRCADEARKTSERVPSLDALLHSLSKEAP